MLEHLLILMKALFEVTTIEADWKPPFKKNTIKQEYAPAINEAFDRITGNGNDEAVFKLLQVSGDRAMLQYSKLFTPKILSDGHNKDKTFWATRGQEEVLSYLWGEKGVTKRITYKGMAQMDSDSSETEESG